MYFRAFAQNFPVLYESFKVFLWKQSFMVIIIAVARSFSNLRKIILKPPLISLVNLVESSAEIWNNKHIQKKVLLHIFMLMGLQLIIANYYLLFLIRMSHCSASMSGQQLIFSSKMCGS